MTSSVNTTMPSSSSSSSSVALVTGITSSDISSALQPHSNLLSLDEPSLAAALATLSLLLLLRASHQQTQLHLFPGQLALAPSHNQASPSEATRSTLLSLVQAANRTATDNACSSVLAGPSSESDEYGDVAFWLGPSRLMPFTAAKGNEADVLRILGLPSDVNIVSSPHCPLLTKQPIAPLLSGLKCVHTFIANVPGDSSTQMYFLVGLLDSTEEDQWVGLVGAGVWSDS